MRTVTVDGLEVVLCDTIAETGSVGVTVSRGPWESTGTSGDYRRTVVVSLVPPGGTCICGYGGSAGDGLRCLTGSDPVSGDYYTDCNYSYTGTEPPFVSHVFPVSPPGPSPDGLSLAYQEIRRDWCELRPGGSACSRLGVEEAVVTRITVCAGGAYYKRARVELVCEPVNGGVAVGGGQFDCHDEGRGFTIDATANLAFRFSRARKRYPVGDPSVDGPFTSVPVLVPVSPLLRCVPADDENVQEYVVEFVPEYTNRILITDDGGILVTDHRESPILLHA